MSVLSNVGLPAAGIVLVLLRIRFSDPIDFTDIRSWLPAVLRTLLEFSLVWLASRAYRIFIYPHYVSPYRHLPGPKGGHWFLGHFPKFFSQKYPWSIYVDWAREYPGVPVIRYLTIANNEVLVPLTADGMKECLMTKCYDFKKTDQWLRMVVDFAGWGIVSFSGDAHRNARRMLSKPFSLTNIRKLEPVFREKADDLCTVMDEICSRAAAEGQTGVIDVIELMSKATLDIMGVAALGRELAHLQSTGTGGKAGGDGKSEKPYDFHDAYQSIVAPDLTGKLLMFASGYLNVRWLPLAANREFKFATNYLRQTLLQLIRQRTAEIRDAVQRGTYEAKDARDILTFIVEENIASGEGIPEEEFVGNLLQIMVAGHETSATVLTWSAYMFAQNHAIQDAVRAEISALLAKHPVPTYTELETLLPYTDGLLKEVMRVFSPAAVTYRQAAKDLVFQGVPLRQGTVLDVIPAVTQMDPQVWGDTVDDFDPTRWSRLTPAQADPYVFAGFSNGPRICLGKTFAWLEMKIVLVHMVPRFRFLSIDKPFEIETPALATRPAGMEIQIEKI